MILKEQENDFPRITYLCPEKWIVGEEDFEMPNKAAIPAIFFTDSVKCGDKLIVSYGACNEKACIMELDCNKIISEVKKFPYNK